MTSAVWTKPNSAITMRRDYLPTPEHASRHSQRDSPLSVARACAAEVYAASNGFSPPRTSPRAAPEAIVSRQRRFQ